MNQDKLDQLWLPRLGNNPAASLRMFCVPYAGSGASTFYPWKMLAPEHVEVCPIQLPGREERVKENHLDQFDAMLDALFTVVSRHLELPFIIYGHSMGAGLAFELARRLHQQCHQGPRHLFVAAHRSPDQPYGYPHVRSVSQQQVLQVLSRFNGMPRAVLENAELMEMVLPILRADMMVCESYEYRDLGKLECPLTLFTGTMDGNVAPHEMPGWANQTHG
ncbi:MAG: hypothetical protein RL748_785, partial [Pseudomonadota bacterium]